MIASTIAEWGQAPRPPPSADAQRHDADVLGDPGDADAVVALGADDPGGVDAVPAVYDVVVGRVAVGHRGARVEADEVGPVEVVDDPVAIVVDPVGHLARIGPGDLGEVGMFEAVAGVDVGDDGRRPADVRSQAALASMSAPARPTRPVDPAALVRAVPTAARTAGRSGCPRGWR